MKRNIDHKLLLIPFFLLYSFTQSYTQQDNAFDQSLQYLSENILIGIHDTIPNKKNIKIVFLGVSNLNGEVAVLENYIDVKILHYLISDSQRLPFTLTPSRPGGKERKRSIEISSSGKGDLALEIILIPTSNGLELIANVSKNPYQISVKDQIDWDRQMIQLLRAGNYYINLPIEVLVLLDDSCPEKIANEVAFNMLVDNRSRDSLFIDHLTIQFSVPVSQNAKTRRCIYKRTIAKNDFQRNDSIRDNPSGPYIVNDYFTFEKNGMTSFNKLEPGQNNILMSFYISQEGYLNPEDLKESEELNERLFWNNPKLEIDQIEVKIVGFPTKIFKYGCTVSLGND